MEVRRQVHCFLILIIFFALISTYSLHDSFQGQLWTSRGHSTPPVWDEHALHGLNLTATFEYRRQCINPRPKSGLVRTDRGSFNAEGNLLTESATLHTKDLAHRRDDASFEALACHQPLTIDVPESAERKSEFDGQELLLGVATSLDRLIVSLPQWAHFLKHTRTPVVTVLRDYRYASAEPVKRAKDMAFALDIDLTIVGYAEAIPADMNADNIHKDAVDGPDNFSICWGFHMFKRPTTKWFVVMDDDTFFPSMPLLMQALKRYDPTTVAYFGALAESKQGRAHHDPPQAPGGASFIMTLPLLQTLVPHFPNCLTESKSHGDATWNFCIRNSTHPMLLFTELPGLHQMGIRGDPSGWYEAAPWPLLTLHHWKSYYHFPVYAANLVSAVAGPEAFLARWLFPGANVVFANGYSIVRYNQGIPDLASVEVTFEGAKISGYTDVAADLDRLAPVRRPYNDEHPSPVGGPQSKESWVLEHAVREGETVRQFYVKRGAVDSVIQLDWTKHGELSM